MTAFISKNDYYIEKIKQQLRDKGINDIDVLPAGSDTSKYTNVYYDVEPNKEVSYIWDFGSLQLHGDPREKYQILPSNSETREINTRNSKQSWEFVNEIQGKDIFVYDGSEYSKVIEYYRGINYKKTDSDKIITSMMVSIDPEKIIEGLFELMYRIYGDCYPYKKFNTFLQKEEIVHMKSFYYENSHVWTASSWVSLYNDLEEGWEKRKVIKALKTRCKNILRKPNNLYALKFFAEKLREDFGKIKIPEQSSNEWKEQDVKENLNEWGDANTSKDLNEWGDMHIDIENHYHDFYIDDGDIPF